jgi:hypothetical protein
MRTLISAAIVAAMLALGCTSPNEGRVSAALGTTSQLAAGSITGDQTTLATHLFVTVTAVKVRVEPDERAEPTRGEAEHRRAVEPKPVADEDESWFTVFSGALRIDLADLGSDVRLLGMIGVPAGRVTQIRLQLADDVLLVQNGASTAVACPSCATSGLKIEVDDDALVTAGGHLQLTMAVDLRLSLVLDNGRLTMRPVLKIRTEELDH